MAEYLLLELGIRDGRKRREGEYGELLDGYEEGSGVGTFFESFRGEWGGEDRDDLAVVGGNELS